MTTIVPDEEFIKRNYDKTIELIKKVYKVEEENRFYPSLLRMIEEFGTRYALCPASSNVEYYSAFPGGLCYHNLQILQNMVKLANILAPKEISYESILKVSILHEIGKIGDKDKDLYIPVQEEWKKKNGTLYETNKDIEYMKINQRSLHLCLQYGIPLTQDEYLAILLADTHDEANKPYKYKEPKLALLLQFSKQWSQKLESTFTVNYS